MPVNIMLPAPHIIALRHNAKEVMRLIDIHAEITGSRPGRRRNVQVLNKSAIMLLVACWEAYVEDLATNVFDHMLSVAKSPSVFPDYVLSIAGKPIAKSGSLNIWSLADDGWKQALITHRDRILEKYVVKGSFNTPSAANIDRLNSELFGLETTSENWFWKGFSTDMAKQKLQDLIDLRGEIAHRVTTSREVYKKDVDGYKKFIWKLAVITHNRAMRLVFSRTKTRPWKGYKHGSTK